MMPDERAARVHYHEYSGEGIREHAERIVALEELVMDMWTHSYCSIAKTREDDDRHIEDVITRMRELGVIE